jgi:sterol desaturase/sphingolipid hydroxylase (fatty acid hydroxylase superfamily)
MAKIAGLIIGFIVLSVVFGIVQRVWPGRSQRWWRRGMKTDLGWWFFDPLINKPIALVTVGAAVVGIAAVSGVPLDKQHIQDFVSRDTAVSGQPGWLQAAEALLWFELIGYWSHRAFHRLGVLWSYHAIHHSSTELDWLSSVRVHPVNEVGTRLAQAIPLVLIGYSPGVLLAYVPLLTLYAIMLHANVNWNFGWLKYVLGSPVYHRWHHTSEKEGLDKNFSAMFPFVDKLFGTLYLPKDRMPMEFGVVGERIPDNLFKQLVYPFVRGKA